MVERKWGRIVNVSSLNGIKGAFGQTNYAAAKAGMHGFTKSLALESARKGVTVNTISPGYIGTKMVTSIDKERRRVALTMIEHEIAIMDDDGEELDAGMAAILRESDFAPHDFESLPPLVDEEIPVTLPDLVLIEGKTLFFGDN